jgi:hypothetical protein
MSAVSEYDTAKPRRNQINASYITNKIENCCIPFPLLHSSHMEYNKIRDYLTDL